ncbi:GNAT family N-acetyltransferase [Streptococcus pluranimalium]|uniref:GNAT family N-acetyltransferase n=1 Tax=Streptococcus pluranimalium TaxID=82348 RepID=UPI002414E2FD|nr:GNAT family N-acetyltransferase [Streptococcus pluranimalium]MDY3041899.1 GNAT family N-acetyltransferase [Streptococcus pluranimalium]WFM80645.1 GNAT family N-acetyltransferase [Streptococcus pluranimalium]HEM6115748.1 GNAT family N-acetyltransferase [Streptococcus suis]
MNHKGTVQLETDRLILRKFQLEDAEPMFDNCWSELDVWKWTSYDEMSCVADLVEKNGLFTEWWLSLNDQANRYNWAIVLQSTSQPIGRIFVIELSEENAELEITYEIGKKWWYQGLMTEALKEIIRFLFEDVQVNRIVAYHAKENPASGKVMKKVGMTFCKMVPGAYTCHAGTFDSYYYSIENQ